MQSKKNTITDSRSLNSGTAVAEYKKVHHLPKLSTPLEETAVFVDSPKPKKKRESIPYAIENIAKSYGQSPSQGSSPVQKYLKVARDQILTQEQQKSIALNNLPTILQDLCLKILATPAGNPFRQTFARRIKTKLFGSPQSQVGPILDAVGAITFLAMSSKTEDIYGTVYRDIPRILRTFANITIKIESFIEESSFHWTDIGLTQHPVGDKRVEEAERLVAQLKLCLGILIEAYAEYAKDMGLGAGEVREARRAAGLSDRTGRTG